MTAFSRIYFTRLLDEVKRILESKFDGKDSSSPSTTIQQKCQCITRLLEKIKFNKHQVYSFIHRFLTKTGGMKNLNVTMIHDPDD